MDACALDTWDYTLICCGGPFCALQVVQKIPDLHHLDASSTPQPQVVTQIVSRLLHVPCGQKSLFVENHYMKGKPYTPLKAQIVSLQRNDGLTTEDTSLEH